MAEEIINETELLDRLEGDEDLLRDLIDMFLSDSSALLQAVLDALAGQDAAALERAAHKLKGTVSIFGGRQTTQAAQALETMGREGDLRQAEGASAHLREQIEALKKSLVALKEKHAPSSSGG